VVKLQVSNRKLKLEWIYFLPVEREISLGTEIFGSADISFVIFPSCLRTNQMLVL
jgi:hypothetical protein